MAKELTYEIRRTWASGVEQSRTQTSGTISTDQAAKRVFSTTLAIGTSEESQAIPGDVTPGVAYIRNLDATNFVSVGTATGVYWAKLLAGEAMAVPWTPANTTIYLLADTSACDVYIEVYSR